ncbi:hypothetical protein ACIBJE_22240 [Micromonospora sp. NPDC050187]|uniref:hypothetical protein n=1 Tax=Micromonospora sp. NPDC050187 TaxID=3364277 RepID=UPI0037B3DD74
MSWPAAILPDGRATATWSLDCRSLANPSRPAPDIGGATLEVRIYQGEYTWDSGTMIKGQACLSVGNPRPSCSVTTDTPCSSACRTTPGST